jgi:hypothetical protein
VIQYGRSNRRRVVSTRPSDGYRYPIDTKRERSTKRHQIVNLRVVWLACPRSLTIHFGLTIETDNAEKAYSAVQQLISSFSATVRQSGRLRPT